MEFKEELKRAAEEFNMPLTDIQLDAYNIYYDLLIDWNKRMNLTAITAPKDAALKHIIDSISPYKKELFSSKSVIDVGTGAGFPGLPLKIYDDTIDLNLLDSLAKRIKFLETVINELGLKNARTIHARAEDAAKQKDMREKYDIAISRAVATLPILLEYTLPFIKDGGMAVFLKGMKYEEEIIWAKKALSILGGKIAKVMPVKLPELKDKRAVIYIKKIKKTPSMYPRKAGTPEKLPIL